MAVDGSFFNIELNVGSRYRLKKKEQRLNKIKNKQKDENF